LRNRVFRWIRSSIYLKLLLIVIAAHLLIIYASIYTHKAIFRSTRYRKAVENSVNFCRYIVDDIGSPADTSRARELAEELNISIRITEERFTWENPDGMRKIESEKLSQYSDSEVRAGFDDGFEAEIKKGETTYQLLLQNRDETVPYAAEILMFLNVLYITLFVAVVLLAVRWQIKPFRLLQDSAERMSEGELDFELSTKRKDELGALVETFNKMRGKIREMIQCRDQLLLDVSHEFRSPLTRMKVSLEMMEDSEDRNNLISDINELETMITELLEGARLNSHHGDLNLSETDLAALVRDVCLEFEGREPGIELSPEERSPVIEADRQRLRILFKNIIANALKYSEPLGRPVEIAIEEAGDEVTISVRDYGRGIPEKEIPFIFEPFYRVDKSRTKGSGGYGLGMHLSKRIVDAHGGAISIDSGSGKGTTVTVTLRREPGGQSQA